MRSRIDDFSTKLNNGFSLPELIVSCGLLVAIVSFALPSFRQLIEQNRLNSASIELVKTLSLARSSALTHGKTVLICQLQSIYPLHCIDSHRRNRPWDLGWLVFIDNNRDGLFSTEDKVLRQFTATEGIPLVFNQNGRLRFCLLYTSPSPRDA